MKRRYLICIVAMLVLSLVSTGALAACNPKGEFPISDELITITCFAPVDEEWDQENNYYLQKFRDELNINLDITHRTLTGNDARTTITMMLASNDYPELFLNSYTDGFTMSDMLSYGVRDGIFIPLNDLYDQYADSLAELREYNETYYNIMVAPDGNIYGVNNYSECGHCMAYPKIYLRWDWLNALGYTEQPETTDELYEMLVAIRDGDPNGNGIADEIPLTADVQETLDAVIMNYFLPYFPKVGDWINGSNYCYLDEDGVVHYAGLEENFKKGLEYIHKLYSEGLIDTNAWSQTMEQGKTAVCTEPYVFGGICTMHLSCLIDTTIEVLYANFHILQPVASETGARYAAYNPPVNDNVKALAVITDKCAHPEEAFRLIDYMMSPQSSFERTRSVEGVEWEYAPEGITNIRGGEYIYQINTIVDSTDSDETHYFSVGPCNNILPERNKYSPDYDWDILNSDPTYYEARLEKETIQVESFYYDEYVLPNTLFMSADDMEEFNELTAVLNEYMISSVAQFCTGGWSIEDDWDNFQTTLKNYGVDRLLELYQAAYDNYSQYDAEAE